MNEIIPFSYSGRPIRVVRIDGEPWWVAADVCATLGIGNPRQAVAYLDDDEVTQVPVTTNDGSERMMPTNVVSEPGLYSLILRSRKPEAKTFKRWITHDVLPAIREAGKYEIPQDYAGALELAARKVREVAALEKRNAELAPLAAEAEHHRAATGLKAVGDFANDLKAWAKTHHPDIPVRHQDVWNQLGRIGLVIRGDTIRHNQPTATAIDNGYAVPKVSDYDTPEGNRSSTTTRLTPKGEGYAWDRLTAYIEANGTLELPRRIGGVA